jgi:2-polyprenyl-6-methoxyphenol hydroxylase-like FAD-dependent oxidoreductase
MFLFVFADEHMAGPDPRDLGEIKSMLRKVFGDAGWECRDILDVLERADDIYFDRVSQIIMDHWSRGRVMLIGDAACAVSMMAGEGTGLAMLAAYVLAGELNRAGGDHTVAFCRHEQLLRSLIASKQTSAQRFAAALTPKTLPGLWIRNQLIKLLAINRLGEWIIRREFRDDFQLADCGM